MIKIDSHLVIPVVMELWGSSQTLTDSGSSGPCVPHFPVCSCPLSFFSAMSPVFLFSLLFCPAIHRNVTSFLPSLWGKHLLQMSSTIIFMLRNLSAFLSSLRKELSRDTSPRCIADYPCETGACLVPLHPLGDCWRPSTVPLAPGLLSNDVIGEE